jgi:hypothetical protein
MGKKTKKNPSKPTKQETLFPSFIPQLSKTLFVLFSLAGHFTANDYTRFLDDFPADKDIHSDDEVDEIINSMEYNEQDRMNVSEGLQSLAGAVVESMSTENMDLRMFEKIENLISNLISMITSYQDVILKQRQILLDLRQIITRISRSCEFAFHPFLKYVLMFQELSRQYIRQLDWEKSCLSQAELMLQDGSIYSHFNGADGKQAGIVAQKRMRTWATGISNCTMLNHKQWMQAKELMIEQFLSVNCTFQETENKRLLEREHTDIILEGSNTTSLISCSSSAQDVLRFSSIQGTINAFCSSPIFEQYLCEEYNHDHIEIANTAKALFILVTGPAGCGKTYLCNVVESHLRQEPNGSTNESDIVGELFRLDNHLKW